MVLSILLEFEMVNPGFFIGYMKDEDDNIKQIVNKIRKYSEKKIEEKCKKLTFFPHK